MSWLGNISGAYTTTSQVAAFTFGYRAVKVGRLATGLQSFIVLGDCRALSVPRLLT